MCKLLVFLPLQRKQQAYHFCIVFLARRNLVALQEEIVDKVLCLTYQGRIALLPIAVLGVELLFHLRADGLQPYLVIFFRQQMGGIGDDIGQQAEVSAILKGRNVRFCTSPLGPIIRLGLVAYPQQMGKLVGISKGILHGGEVGIELRLGQERPHGAQHTPLGVQGGKDKLLGLLPRLGLCQSIHSRQMGVEATDMLLQCVGIYLCMRLIGGIQLLGIIL